MACRSEFAGSPLRFGFRSKAVTSGLFELLLCPEVGRCEDWNDFKFDQVFLLADPTVQQFRMQRFHDLETTRARRINPACVIGDALRQHAISELESLTNGSTIALFEAFNNHEEHGSKCTPPGSHFKLTPCGVFNPNACGGLAS